MLLTSYIILLLAHQVRMRATEKCFEEKLRAKFDTTQVVQLVQTSETLIQLFCFYLWLNILQTRLFNLHCIRMQILSLDVLWTRRKSMGKVSFISQDFWPLLYVTCNAVQINRFPVFYGALSSGCRCLFISQRKSNSHSLFSVTKRSFQAASVIFPKNNHDVIPNDPTSTHIHIYSSNV